MKRESFVFYKSFYDSIKELDPKDQVQIYNAIFSYQFDGEIIELNGVCKSIFTLIIPQLEANNKRYINGCKGGAPKNNQNAKKKQPKNNQKTTKKQPNDNDNVNDNVNDNDNDNVNDIKEEIDKEEKRFKKPTIQEIDEYCRERNNGIDGEKFYDFYESKGWMVGKNKMKDWKACIRTWEQKDKKQDNLPKWFGKDFKKQDNGIDELNKLLEDFN